jgi:hypothetical protein
VGSFAEMTLFIICMSPKCRTLWPRSAFGVK